MFCVRFQLLYSYCIIFNHITRCKRLSFLEILTYHCPIFSIRPSWLSIFRKRFFIRTYDRMAEKSRWYDFDIAFSGNDSLLDRANCHRMILPINNVFETSLWFVCSSCDSRCFKTSQHSSLTSTERLLLDAGNAGARSKGGKKDIV